MKRIKENVSNTLIINKSKFITSLFIVKNESEVDSILKEINKKYYDATHNVYAYILNEGKSQKCSDNGEPQGTAGRPTLDVLQKQNLTDILAVTTRYFGGIKLGAGGLTRAYSNSVSEALKLTSLEDLYVLDIYELSITYPTYSRISDFLSQYKIFKESFSDEVVIQIGIKQSEVNSFLTAIKSLTLGKLTINYLYSDNS